MTATLNPCRTIGLQPDAPHGDGLNLSPPRPGPDRNRPDARDDICRAAAQTASYRAADRGIRARPPHTPSRTVQTCSAARAAGSGCTGRHGAVRLQRVPCGELLQSVTYRACGLIHPTRRRPAQPDHDLQSGSFAQQRPESTTDAALESISIDRALQRPSADDESERADRLCGFASGMDRRVGSRPTIPTGQHAAKHALSEQPVRTGEHQTERACAHVWVAGDRTL